MYPAPKVKHYTLELSDSTATEILTDFGDEVHFGVSFTVQNIDNSAIVYIGDATVSSSSFGMKLASGAVATFEDMPRYPEIYAISNTADSEIAVMRISK
jgi:hypothetical protein